jgi:hypothetical protein
MGGFPPPQPWAHSHSLGHLTPGHYRVLATLDLSGGHFALPIVEFDVLLAPLEVPLLSTLGFTVFAVALIFVALVQSRKL